MSEYSQNMIDIFAARACLDIVEKLQYEDVIAQISVHNGVFTAKWSVNGVKLQYCEDIVSIHTPDNTGWQVVEYLYQCQNMVSKYNDDGIFDIVLPIIYGADGDY